MVRPLIRQELAEFRGEFRQELLADFRQELADVRRELLERIIQLEHDTLERFDTVHNILGQHQSTFTALLERSIQAERDNLRRFESVHGTLVQHQNTLTILVDFMNRSNGNNDSSG